MYLLLPRFTSDISYQSIALYKYKLTPSWWPSWILYYEYHFQVLDWSCTMIYSEMFKPSLCRYSTRSQITLDIPLQKTNTGQKRLSFLRSNIRWKANPSIKNVKKRLSSCMLWRKIFYCICKHTLMQTITTLLW